MASNLTVDTLTKGATTLNTDELVDVNNTRVCKAWVNFNGTGTVAIRASFNTSSITDNGAGDYTINFTTALSDADYSTTGMSGGVNTGYVLGVYSSAAPPSTTAVRVGNFKAGVGLADEAYINVTVFR